MKISCDAIPFISGIYLIRNNVNNKVYIVKEKLINIYLITIKNLINYKMDLDNKINDIVLKIPNLETYNEIIENAELLLKYAKRANKIHNMICDLDEIERDDDNE